MLKIDSLRVALESGEIEKLPTRSSIGGYPLYYISSYCNVYCADCANNMLDDEYEDIVDYTVHWEGEPLFCECGRDIQSAYGVPEDNEEENKND